MTGYNRQLCTLKQHLEASFIRSYFKNDAARDLDNERFSTVCSKQVSSESVRSFGVSWHEPVSKRSYVESRESCHSAMVLFVGFIYGSVPENFSDLDSSAVMGKGSHQ